MSYKNYLMCGAFCLPALCAAGQDSTKWSLQQCIDYAIEHNIQLKQNEIAEQQGAADLAQKRAELFPSLSFSTTQSISYRPLQESASNIVTNGIANNSTNKFTENGNYGLNASWTVWDGGANYKNVKAQKLQNQISALTTQTTANSIQEQITQLYIQILYSKDALEVNRSMAETAQSQHERGKEMFEQGQISKADLTQLESQAASAEYDCVATQTQIANYTRQLKELLEITDGRKFDIQGIRTADDVATQIIPNVGEVYQAGTLSGNPLAMAAGIATLRQLKNMDYAALERRVAAFAHDLRDILAAKNVPIQMPTIASMFCPYFSETPVENFDDAKKCDQELFTTFYKQMRAQGIYLAPSGYETGMVSFVHTDDDFARALDAARKVTF